MTFCVQLLMRFWAYFSCPFLVFFAFGRHLGEAAFLKEVPSEILVFGGGGHPRNAPKVCPEGGPKMDLEKDTKITFLCFFLASFLVSWASLVALCCSLVASWPPGSKEGAQEQRQGGQEPPKSRPGEAKRGPREPKGSQKCSGEPGRGPRESIKVFRRAREKPKRGQESVKESQDRPKRDQATSTS